MINGIAVIGLNGSGKSTLTHALAKKLNYFEMDIEDYYFPSQRVSRQMALENTKNCDSETMNTLPFANPKSKYEVEESLIEDIKTHKTFIISGVTMNWSDEIISKIDLAIWIKTPLEIRLKRIKTREEKRFGSRVLEGGDMFLQQLAFQDEVKNRELKTVEASAINLNCPLIELDGTRPVSDHINKILSFGGFYED